MWLGEEKPIYNTEEFSESIVRGFHRNPGVVTDVGLDFVTDMSNNRHIYKIDETSKLVYKWMPRGRGAR